MYYCHDLTFFSVGGVVAGDKVCCFEDNSTVAVVFERYLSV